MAGWIRKHGQLIIIVVAVLGLTLQVFSWFGIQPRQLAFFTKPLLTLSILQISLVVLVTGLIAYRSAYRAIAKRSGPLLSYDDIDRFNTRFSEAYYPDKVDELRKQWHEVLGSPPSITTEANVTAQVSVEDQFDLTLERQCAKEYRFFIKKDCEFSLIFEQKKSYTITELESIAKDLPKIQNYVEELKAVGLSGQFESQTAANEYGKTQINRILAILENIKKSISG